MQGSFLQGAKSYNSCLVAEIIYSVMCCYLLHSFGCIWHVHNMTQCGVSCKRSLSVHPSLRLQTWTWKARTKGMGESWCTSCCRTAHSQSSRLFMHAKTLHSASVCPCVQDPPGWGQGHESRRWQHSKCWTKFCDKWGDFSCKLCCMYWIWVRLRLLEQFLLIVIQRTLCWKYWWRDCLYDPSKRYFQYAHLLWLMSSTSWLVWWATASESQHVLHCTVCWQQVSNWLYLSNSLLIASLVDVLGTWACCSILPHEHSM